MRRNPDLGTGWWIIFTLVVLVNIGFMALVVWLILTAIDWMGRH